MSPVKIFLKAKLWPRITEYQSTGAEPAWLRDPLFHPDLQNMSPSELADLPLAWTKASASPRECYAQP